MRFNVPVLCMEGEATADGRLFDQWAWRELPLTLLLQDTGAHGGPDPGPSRVCGVIESITRGEEGGAVAAVIDTDDEGDAGQEAARLIEAGIVTGISVDFSWADDDLAMECQEEDEDGWCLAMTLHWSLATIMGATIVPFPAFAGARIDPSPIADSTDADEEEEAPELVASLTLNQRGVPLPRQRSVVAAVDLPSDQQGDQALVAAARPSLARPPAAWFADPELDGPTMLTITDDGQVYGHVAYWDACHVSFPDRCVPPPRSSAGYGHFRVGRRVTDAGEVQTGPLVIGTDHAPVRGPRAGASDAVDHYAHSGCAWADVVAGDDRHGIYVAGALRPGLTEEQLVAVRASAPSGDWRRIGDRLELVAVLSVNTPGFRPPLGMVASGSEVLTASRDAFILLTPPEAALAASGEPCGCEEPNDAEVELQAILRALTPAARDVLRARLRAS